MATGNNSHIFDLSKPQCRRIIDVDVERAGDWPQIPKPEDSYTDGGLKGTLIKYWIEPHPPTLSPDGVTRVYRITAHYVYAMNRPPTAEEEFRVGVAPHTRYLRDGNEVKFKPDIAYGNPELHP